MPDQADPPPPAQPNAPLASVIIVAYRGAALLPACLRSVSASRGVAFETIVVDNGSPDDSAAIVARDFPHCRLIRTGRNLGFAGGNNAGMREARGKFFVLLNQDTEVPPNWLAQILEPFDADPRMGVVGCKLLYPDGRTIQHAGGAIYPNANSGHYGNGDIDEGQWNEPRPIAYVTGAAMALRREAVAEVGLLDEGYHPAYYEEMDWQWRMWKAGWKVFYTPTDGVKHHESQVLGAGSRRFVFLYTRHRLRYLALNGTPRGKGPALRHECYWFFHDVLFTRNLWPVLHAYCYALKRWNSWRAERLTRPGIPWLGP